MRAAKSAPHVGIDALVPSGGLLILSPHPDDETFGCGMALAACIAAGRDVRVVTMTDGEASHPGSIEYPPDLLAKRRIAELEDALCRLAPEKTVPIHRLHMPDAGAGQASEVERVAPELLALVREHCVGTIWTTWKGDPHCDHRTAASLARQVAEEAALHLLYFPVWGRFGSLEVPDEIVVFSQSEHRKAKERAVAAFASQTGRLIHDDPGGFTMPEQFVEHFVSHPEIFIHER